MSALDGETTESMGAPHRKIAVAVRDDLEVWQKLNVATFLTSGFGNTDPGVIGDVYRDADGREYPPMLAHPVRVHAGDEAAVRRGFDRALGRALMVSVYTYDMFATMTDADNRAAVAAVGTADMEIAGFAVSGDPKQVDKAFDKLKLHG